MDLLYLKLLYFHKTDPGGLNTECQGEKGSCDKLEVRKSVLRAEAPTRCLSRHRYIEYIYAELKANTKDGATRQP